MVVSEVACAWRKSTVLFVWVDTQVSMRHKLLPLISFPQSAKRQASSQQLDGYALYAFLFVNCKPRMQLSWNLVYLLLEKFLFMKVLVVVCLWYEIQCLLAFTICSTIIFSHFWPIFNTTKANSIGRPNHIITETLLADQCFCGSDDFNITNGPDDW